jgi:hypothetical protein
MVSQVLIDDHTEDRTVVSSKDTFVNRWVDLVTKLTAVPIVKQRLMIDVLNEPE